MMAAEHTHTAPTLGALLQPWLPPAQPWARLAVTGLALDSRRLRAGDVFLAYPGTDADGRDFAAAAEAGGAAAIVCEPGRRLPVDIPVVPVAGLRRRAGMIAARFYRQPSLDLAVVGVTGTNGKTTCVRLISQLWRALGRSAGSLGTLGAETDGTVSDGSLTTLDPVALQAQLAQWRDQGLGAVAMEVSSHALDQARVAGTHFNAAVFTNLSRDHLDYHADMDAYLAAKTRLFSDYHPEHVILNADDPASAELARRCAPATRVLRYSARGAPVEVRCIGVEYRPDGSVVDVASPWGEWRLHSPLLGEFNVANLLAALTAVTAVQRVVDSAALRRAVAGLMPVPGRLQVVGNGPRAVVDYAHTPAALSQALEALRRHCRGRLICVMGAGGDRDAGKRPLMGAAAAAADRIWVTSDNPRSEPPETIAAAVVSGIPAPAQARLRVELDRGEAIRQALAEAAPEDWVLIAGKGHEAYQQIGAERLPFRDVEVATAALAGQPPGRVSP